MADHITIRPAGGTWSIRAGGAVLGETSNALELVEGNADPVIYIPRTDIAMAFLDQTTSTTTCPHKGVATYYAIVAKSGPIPDAAWSYENPKADVAQIKDYLAFYPGKTTVEKI